MTDLLIWCNQIFFYINCVICTFISSSYILHPSNIFFLYFVTLLFLRSTVFIRSFILPYIWNKCCNTFYKSVQGVSSQRFFLSMKCVKKAALIYLYRKTHSMFFCCWNFSLFFLYPLALLFNWYAIDAKR